MPDINFLHNAENNDASKRDNKKKEIIWSKPASDSSGAVPKRTQETGTPLAAPDRVAIKKGIFFRLFGSAASGQVVAKEISLDNEKKEPIVKKQPAGAEEAFWHNPEILETNLIKDEIISFFDWKKNILFLCFFIFISLAIIGVAYFWLDSWGKRKEAENAAFISGFTKLKEEIRVIEKEQKIIEANIFKKKLSLIKSLLDNHAYWTNFFDFLEKNTVDDIYYTGGFKGGRGGQYSLSAKTSSFNIISEQVKALRNNDMILNADVNSGEIKSSDKKEDREVNFTLSFTIDPSIFLK